MPGTPVGHDLQYPGDIELALHGFINQDIAEFAVLRPAQGHVFERLDLGMVVDPSLDTTVQRGCDGVDGVAWIEIECAVPPSFQVLEVTGCVAVLGVHTLSIGQSHDITFQIVSCNDLLFVAYRDALAPLPAQFLAYAKNSFVSTRSFG